MANSNVIFSHGATKFIKLPLKQIEEVENKIFGKKSIEKNVKCSSYFFKVKNFELSRNPIPKFLYNENQNTNTYINIFIPLSTNCTISSNIKHFMRDVDSEIKKNIATIIYLDTVKSDKYLNKFINAKFVIGKSKLYCQNESVILTDGTQLVPFLNEKTICDISFKFEWVWNNHSSSGLSVKIDYISVKTADKSIGCLSNINTNCFKPILNTVVL